MVNAHEVLGREATLELTEHNILLLDFMLQPKVEDVIVCPYDMKRRFSVRSCYNRLIQEQVQAVKDQDFTNGLQLIWGAQVLSKLKVFGRRVL